MFKWLTKHAPPGRDLFRWALLPMPERLLQIAVAPHLASEHADEFSRIITSLWINDVNKRTGRNRLPETLRAMADALPSAPGRLRLLDVGASDGISTYDAVRYLRDALRIPVSATAVDLYTQLHRYNGRVIREYRTSDGSPVLLRAGRIGLRLGRRLAFRPAEWLRTRYLRAASLRSRLRHAQSIPLIHPLAAADPDIVFTEADALQLHDGFVEAFDVVRISNLLNRHYFTRPQMETIVRHAVSYLQTGGLLVVSRNETDDSAVTERGTVWRRCAGGLDHVADFNGGSELRDLIANLEVTSTKQPMPAAA